MILASDDCNLVELRDRWLNPPGTPESELKKRILTNLYNARPQWLDDAHRTLDRAVFAPYGWPDDLSDQQILERLLLLNHERAAAQPAAQAKKTGGAKAGRAKPAAKATQAGAADAAAGSAEATQPNEDTD